MASKFEKEFEMKFRKKIYERCSILINDMEPVIKEVRLFIDKILSSPLMGDDRYTYRISNIIDYSILVQDERIEEKDWRICLNDNVVGTLILIDFENIEKVFKKKQKKELLRILEEEEEIIGFPEELLGKAFICFVETAGDILKGEAINDDEPVFDIFIMSNNGENNIVYIM